MQAFTKLFDAIDATNSTLKKVDALSTYFSTAPPRDAIWALYFLTGRKLKRVLPTKQLRQLLLDLTTLPQWLFEESYAQVGDLAETIALLLPDKPGGDTRPLHEWVEDRLTRLPKLPPEEQLKALNGWWAELGTKEIFLLNKLITGSFRAGVSQSLVTRALAKTSGIAEPIISHRLMGNWEPTATFYERLLSKEETEADPGSPFPFYLASPLTDPPETLGDPGEWLFEWKWDGIRAQCIRRGDHVYLWSRGEELITERFPEITEVARELPQGTVLDGELLAHRDGKALPFGVLQQRIGRVKLTPKVLADAPVVFMAFDLLEDGGEDLRERPLRERRRRMERILKDLSPKFLVSSPVVVDDWTGLAAQRATSRENRVEGLMMKRYDSKYKVGRKRGDWWKWKVEPFTMDAVLLYAQAGHGRRATLYTDYTFGVWKGDELVPVAKAYSGLTDAEINTMDRWIRQNTIDRFGPVRSVKPTEVFELAFEAIAPSPRHKAGIAVRFPRILRKRDDKPPQQADTLERLKELMNAQR